MVLCTRGLRGMKGVLSSSFTVCSHLFGHTVRLDPARGIQRTGWAELRHLPSAHRRRPVATTHLGGFILQSYVASPPAPGAQTHTAVPAKGRQRNEAREGTVALELRLPLRSRHCSCTGPFSPKPCALARKYAVSRRNSRISG